MIMRIQPEWPDTKSCPEHTTCDNMVNRRRSDLAGDRAKMKSCRDTGFVVNNPSAEDVYQSIRKTSGEAIAGRDYLLVHNIIIVVVLAPESSTRVPAHHPTPSRDPARVIAKPRKR